MKKSHKISIVIVVGLLLGISCTDDITLEPISSITSNSFFKTQNDAEGAITGVYDLFREIADEQCFSWGEARAMELEGGRGSRDMTVFENRMTPLNPGPNWYNLYKIVHHTNLILKYVPDIDGFSSDNEKNRVLAQAYTMRAFCYFTIAKTWGDAVLVTEPTESYDPEALYKERTPVAEVFTVIKQDINDAVSLFPDNSFPEGRNRWSKSSANALKADIYLWTGKRMTGGQADFTVALNALNEIVASDIELLPDFESVFDYNNKGNQEIIMSVNWNKTEASRNYFWTFYIVDGLPTNLTPEVEAKVGLIGGQNYYIVTRETSAKFSNDDLRKEATFYDIYTPDALGDLTVYETSINTKFKGVVISGVRQFINDIIIYRYADVLLMIAEAKNALGQDPSTEINMVRQRAYGANYDPAHVFVSGTQDANDAAILAERDLELLFEGKRWYDLVRFGKAIEQVPALSAGEEWRFLFPIGADVLSRESSVQQNPGYTY